jgi:DNA-binding protein HU-beta
VNRRELVLALAERTGSDRRTADDMLNAFTDIVTETVSTGEPVALSGFCKFARRDSPARMGRNPATGETIRISARRRVRITPLKAFKDAVLSGKAPAKKAPARKTTARKPAAKKAPAKKAAVRKPAAKKTTARKPAAKKTTARKTAPRKTTARKPAAKKTTARKAAARR